MKVFLKSFILTTLENESLPVVLEMSLSALSQGDSRNKDNYKGIYVPDWYADSLCLVDTGRWLGEAFLSLCQMYISSGKSLSVSHMCHVCAVPQAQ